MSGPILAFGTTPWGTFTWGSGVGAGAISVTDVRAVRDNVVRATFTVAPYFTDLFDDPDAANPSKYSIAPVSESVGYNGEHPQPVTIVRVAQYIDGAGPYTALDLELDRPMSPFPCLYRVTLANVFSADLLSCIPTTTMQIDALYRQLSRPDPSTATPFWDFANAQTRSQTISADIPNPTPADLAVYVVTNGDYALDRGAANLQKRILRRLFTRKNGFVFLVGYGAGLPQYVKRLAAAGNLVGIAAECQAQIQQEPDVAAVSVRPILDRAHPNLLRLRIAVRTLTGLRSAFDVLMQR